MISPPNSAINLDNEISRMAHTRGMKAALPARVTIAVEIFPL